MIQNRQRCEEAVMQAVCRKAVWVVVADLTGIGVVCDPPGSVEQW